MSRNPKALALSRDQVDTPAFKAWFADSKVVNECGEPLVVYHGTTKDFTRFKAGRGDLGIHFGTRGQANRRLENGGAIEGARVIPVYLSIKNPLRLKDAGSWNAEAGVTSVITERVMDDDDFAEAFERAVDAVDSSLGFKGVLEFMGYDGVVYGNVGEEDLDFGEEAGDDSWIAFRPEQIKSAIGNRGTYDINSPNILHSFAGPLARTADKGVLGQAQASLEGGADPEHVRQHLGWHKGLDGKMRFEITDDCARLKTKAGNYIDIEVNRNSAGVWGVIKLSDLLDHEQLFAAYPDLADIEVTLKDYGGAGGHAREQGIVLHGAIGARPLANSSDGPFPISQEDADAINAQESRLGDWRIMDPGRVLSTILHEIQHVVQGVEGFAAGGNEKMAMTLNLPESVMRSIALNTVNKEANKKGHKLSESQKVAIAEQVFLGMNACDKKVFDLQRETGLSEEEMSEFFWPDYFEIYRRMHGEIEARNVQARHQMTQSQRKETPPGATADVKGQDAIVFGVIERDANDGHVELAFDGNSHGASRQMRFR